MDLCDRFGIQGSFNHRRMVRRPEIVNVVFVVHCNLMHIESNDGLCVFQDWALHEFFSLFVPSFQLLLKSFEVVLYVSIDQFDLFRGIIHGEDCAD